MKSVGKEYVVTQNDVLSEVKHSHHKYILHKYITYIRLHSPR
jgi:hypothetical protein